MDIQTACAATEEHVQLTAVEANCACVLADLHDCLDPSHRRRLAELGLRKGCVFQVVQKSSAGAVVIKCGASRYAVDRKTAECMAVKVDQ
jgi:Fe2+ transport system protein FeoA